MRVERKLVVRDGAMVRDVLLVGTVTVGRSPSCEISAADPRLSRTHAAFDVMGDEVVVRDLESRNGTTVNGARVTEARLVAGDIVEVGPFVMELVEAAPAPAVAAPAEGAHDGASAPTVLRPRGAPRPAAVPPSPDSSPAPVEAPAAVAPASVDDSASAPTRRMARPPMPAAPVPAVSPAAPTPAAPPAPRPPSSPHAAPPAVAAPAPSAPSGASASAATATVSAPIAAAAAPGRASTSELPFARAMLLWVMPVALVSFLAGLVPDLLQPDQRAPLLQAHYEALAVSAAELVRTSREPAQPLDSITSALRRHAGVTAARIVGADGRVLAPLSEAGTTATVPALSGSESRVVVPDDGPVEIYAPATTADGRAVVAALVVDPVRIHPVPSTPPVATPLLLLCLGAAWLAARRVTAIADTRLSRLGEEVELMTTRQVSVGREPFGLRGAQRIIDAVTFAVSPAGRRSAEGPAAASAGEAPVTRDGAGARSAVIETDAGFRVVRADAGCAELLGVTPGAATGQHLIDVLTDQGVADEVLRLVALATPDAPAQGSAQPAGREFRLAIDVTRGSGGASLQIRFVKV